MKLNTAMKKLKSNLSLTITVVFEDTHVNNNQELLCEVLKGPDCASLS